MKKNVKISIIIFALILIIIILDFLCFRLFNIGPMLAIRNNNIYNAIGYKVWKCNYDDIGNFVHIDSYQSKYSCPEKMPYSLADDINDTCPGFSDFFYEDDSYKYYFSCKHSGYIRYENGRKVTIQDALNNGEIKIEELSNKGLRIDKEPKKLKNVEVSVSSNCNNKLNQIYENDEDKVYLYCLNKFDIIFNVEENFSLKEALLQNKITIPEILEYVEFSAKYAQGSKETNLNGGSILYSNFVYSVLKCNGTNKNNIIIGSSTMNIDRSCCK